MKKWGEMMNYIFNQYVEWGIEETIARKLSIGSMILLIILLCILANFITKKVVIRLITHFVHKNKFTWDNILLERKVFHKLSHIVPALIIYFFSTTFPKYQPVIEKFAVVYILMVSVFTINSLINAINDIYESFEISKERPIKGLLQVIKIAMFILGTILIIAILIGESPLILLSGIGALSAVFLLVFRDSLLGLVAGIQLASNDMVKVGDWIEMPKFKANGDVIDISLNTVKVQNFDKTITMIPSYSLISDSFINWRGMQATGGRRIKRSIFIDTTSIEFCTDKMLDRFKNIDFLKDYIIERELEISQYNEKNKINRSTSIVNGRALTNIGVFRMYILNYLQNHPGIHKEMTLLSRQLEPTVNGLPIEIYAFSNDTTWSVYEAIQADIFDHLFAVAPEFGLRIFQNPTGNDLRMVVQQSEIDENE